MAMKFPRHPKHPESICWGCDKYCSVEDLGCGNGSDRTQHPMGVGADAKLTQGAGIYDYLINSDHNYVAE